MIGTWGFYTDCYDEEEKSEVLIAPYDPTLSLDFGWVAQDLCRPPPGFGVIILPGRTKMFGPEACLTNLPGLTSPEFMFNAIKITLRPCVSEPEEDYRVSETEAHRSRPWPGRFVFTFTLKF